MPHFCTVPLFLLWPGPSCQLELQSVGTNPKILLTSHFFLQRKLLSSSRRKVQLLGPKGKGRPEGTFFPLYSIGLSNDESLIRSETHTVTGRLSAMAAGGKGSRRSSFEQSYPCEPPSTPREGTVQCLRVSKREREDNLLAGVVSEFLLAGVVVRLQVVSQSMVCPLTAAGWRYIKALCTR